MHGSVTARWRASGVVRARPVLTADGRVAVGDDSGVVLLDPRALKPAVRNPVAVPALRSESLTALSGGLAVITRREAFLLAPDLTRRTFPLAEEAERPAVRGVVELDGGDLFAWTDDSFARLSSSLEVRYRGKVEGAMSPAVGQAAVAADATFYVANAMVWVDDDDMERIGHLAAFRGGPASKGEGLFLKEHARDGLPTGTGDELRLVALDDGAVLAERGLVGYDVEGRETWREPDRDSGNPVVLVSPRTLVYGTASATRLVARDMPAAGKASADPRTLLTLDRGEKITGCAGAPDRAYACTNRAVVAIDLDGGVVFRVPDLPADDLILGEGWVLAVQPGGMVRIV